MGFFGDLGGFLGDIGHTVGDAFAPAHWGDDFSKLGGDIKADPWVLAAPAAAAAAAVAAPFALPELAMGATEGAAGAATAVEGGEVLSATNPAIEAALADPELYGTYAAQTAGPSLAGGTDITGFTGATPIASDAGFMPGAAPTAASGAETVPGLEGMTRGLWNPEVVAAEPVEGAGPTAAYATEPPTSLAPGLPGGSIDDLTLARGVPTPPPGGPTSLAPSGSPGIWDSITGAVGKNPWGAIGAGAALGGLGYQVAKGQQASRAEQTLQADAAQKNAAAYQMFSQGRQLADYLQSGTLPTGMQSQLDLLKRKLTAEAHSRAASTGTSTDPSKNSILAADLASIDLQIVSQRTKMAQTLMQEGLKEMQAAGQFGQLSSGDYQKIAELQMKEEQMMGAAIGSFATALGRIQVGQSKGFGS